MSKRLLTVLSICFVAAAGIALYVWASGCCSGDALCNGGALGTVGCTYQFTVDHDRDSGGGTHEVYVWIRPSDDPAFTSHLMAVGSLPPYPVCVEYVNNLSLNADTTYYYYFQCADCSGRDPDSGTHTLNTGSCGG